MRLQTMMIAALISVMMWVGAYRFTESAVARSIIKASFAIQDGR